ncbi:MAG: ABC transporter substrate-binding protein [Dehalococcoidia bacterium]|nr:ABC transporter substrate-binding protein [Dehalococcoidia bacterium]
MSTWTATRCRVTDRARVLATTGYHPADLDLEAARALLEEAGWEQRATLPVRVRLGSEFRITIRTDNDPVRAAIAEEIARQLEPLGIRANVATTSFSVLRRDYLQERRYEAALTGWQQGIDPDPYFGWHSSQMGSAGLNIANYSDAVADRLIEEARRQNGPAVRSDMYIQFQEIWQRNAPSAVIAYPGYVYLQRDTIDPSLPAMVSARSLRFIDIHLWRRS